MKDKFHTIKINIRKDEELEWCLFNPILRDKELCCVIDDGKYKWKIGDGRRTYEELPFIEAIEAIQHFMVYGPYGLVGDINLAPLCEK